MIDELLNEVQYVLIRCGGCGANGLESSWVKMGREDNMRGERADAVFIPSVRLS